MSNTQVKNYNTSTPELNESYVPYVVETSVGLDRMFLATLSTALQTETLPDNTTRDVLKLHPALAPVKATIMPLVKKDGLPKKRVKLCVCYSLTTIASMMKKTR
jgi:glycyl-tRNA synthetase